MKKLNLFIPISKIDEEQRLVYGVMAQEELDASGEVFNYASSKPNFEKWSDDQFKASNGLSKGNVRSMHTSIAAGKLTDISYDDANKRIEGCAKVIDDGEWQKVLEGVYTGFSMGGRYEKRWTEDSVTHYTAMPVEMSLVDKPCIKSALFAGMTKSFQFQLGDNLLQKTDGEATMYVPTNDEILPVARALAKAAGKDESAWLDFVQTATDQIVAEKGDNPFAKHTDENCKVKDCDMCAEKAAAAADDKPAEKVDTVVTVIVDPEDTDTGGDAPHDDAIVAEKVDGVDVVIEPEVEQMWIAKSDGSQHKRKADAIAHDLTVKKGATGEPSLKDLLTATADAVATLAKGDEIVVADVEVPAVPLNEQCDKMVAFLNDPTVVEKSVYHVSRMADLLSSFGSLFVSVKSEAGAEDDASSIPATLMAAVTSMGEALIAMATEEVGELMERLREGESDNMCYPEYYCDLAVSTMGLEKADAAAFFDTAVEAAAPLIAKRAPVITTNVTVIVPDDEMSKAAKAAGFESPVEHLQDQLSKRETELAEITPLVKSLAADVAALKSVPRAPAPRLNILGKGGDSSLVAPGEGGEMAKAEDALSSLSGPELARLAFKVAQRNGHTITSNQ